MVFVFRWGMVLFSLAWSLVILPAEGLRIQYAGMRTALRAGDPVKPAVLDAAIADYKKLADFGVCMPGVREQLASFLSIRATVHAGPDSLARTGADLEQADQILRDMLGCSPFESNQWLSLAMLDVRRNGIRDKSFEYLKLSYLTSPREGWVVERRLTFAASMAPLIPEFLKPNIIGDIDEMKRMLGIKTRFLKRLNLESMDELEKLFS
jgi:hypothetical protein